MAASLPGGSSLEGFRADILRYGAVLRALPWRETRDPWAVLVSEFMLQQTPTSRVLGPYGAFLRQFPDPPTCASAPVSEVLVAWAGLGYNRRALSVHRCATAIVEQHEGHVPDQLGALLALPGVGPYTARAVLAFAFERDVAVVDTNVGRVLARAVAGRPLGVREAQELADLLQAPGDGWAWNQSVMELGAEICTARRPRCADCPVAGRCRWVAAGGSAPDPALGSAGVGGPQSRFEGSDRQARGRLLSALREGPVFPREIARAAGIPEDPRRAQRVADRLVADGLARRGERRSLSLP